MNKSIYPLGDSQHRNHQHLEEVLNELAIWRYRVQSTLLVASSALLALSFSTHPHEVSSCDTLLWLHYASLGCNALQILASIVVLCITLKSRIRIAHTASRELLCQSPHEKTIVFDTPTLEHNLLLCSEFASFAFFVATVLLLAVCRILSLA